MLGPLLAGFLFIAVRFIVPVARVIPWLGSRVCIFRRVSGVPCPFCGLTRSTMAAYSGEWLTSLLYHPLGLVIVVGGWAVALWLTACAVTGRELGLDRLRSALAGPGTLRVSLLVLGLVWLWQMWISPVWPLLGR